MALRLDNLCLVVPLRPLLLVDEPVPSSASLSSKDDVKETRTVAEMLAAGDQKQIRGSSCRPLDVREVRNYGSASDRTASHLQNAREDCRMQRTSPNDRLRYLTTLLLPGMSRMVHVPVCSWAPGIPVAINWPATSMLMASGPKS